MSEPISGRTTSRRIRPILATRSSVPAGGGERVVVMEYLPFPTEGSVALAPAPLQPDSQRLPCVARLWTCAALSLVTKPGPVSTGWPPPMVLRFALYSVSITMGK